jgi:hypothetical protein
MSTLTIRTNNQPRHLIYGYELTAKEKLEFDYIDAEEIDTHEFFRFKGIVYDPSEFMDCSHAFGIDAWHGYYSDSFFSGVLIKYTGNDAVIVGQYFS